MIESPLAGLSDDQLENLAREFDAIHDEVFAELGDLGGAIGASLLSPAPQSPGGART